MRLKRLPRPQKAIRMRRRLMGKARRTQAAIPLSQPLKPEPASPEIPEIFMGEEKALFNTAPIEKAGEEFLTEEELAADDREPNPFDSLFRAVGLVKEKLSLLRRNRRHPEESESEDEEWMEDSEQDETFPRAMRRPGSRPRIFPRRSTPLPLLYRKPKSFACDTVGRKQNQRRRRISPITQKMPQNLREVIVCLSKIAKPAELSQLLAEGMSSPTCPGASAA